MDRQTPVSKTLKPVTDKVTDTVYSSRTVFKQRVLGFDAMQMFFC